MGGDSEQPRAAAWHLSQRTLRYPARGPRRRTSESTATQDRRGRGGAAVGRALARDRDGPQLERAGPKLRVRTMWCRQAELA